MEFLRDFKKISKSDVSLAGGKGASLGKMIKAGIPVPPGFVILSNTFKNFLEQTGLGMEIKNVLASINHKDIQAVEKASDKIQALFLETEMPKQIEKEIQKIFKKLDAKYIAVRSSATAEDSKNATWAGQLESYLNTTKDGLIESVKKCWSSLFTPRAIFYRFENNLRNVDISVAVVIQRMIQSEISGVVFSMHPITKNRNQMLIEAGFGLGEAIVSGFITPDSYIVEKKPRKIINITINTQTKGLFRNPAGGNKWKVIKKSQASHQVLSNKQILKLSELSIKIENRCGFPCDIEWAFENGKFYIVQSRPITTLQMQHADHNKFFKGYTMVSIGKRLANIHEASLKIMARSKIWKTEFGIGYKTAIINSLGECYANIESRDKIENYFKTKDFIYAKNYIKKLYNLRSAVLKEVNKNPKQDFTERFARMMAYFFIIQFIFARIYKKSKPSEQKIIEKWRNDATIFDPLNLYYKIYPKKDKKSEKEWSWVFINGGLKFYNKNITFSGEDKRKAELKKAKFKTDCMIKGSPAYPGIIRGVVRLILSPEDKKLLKDGEIIVAPMTTVDFLPIMEKACAFITDEGGVTSHAAIVARELKKPCIVGTKIATQVLKNGDKVELDADNGIIKIL